MTEMPRPQVFERPASVAGDDAPVGFVLAVAGSSSRVVFDRAALDAAACSNDAVAASAGQVGSQIKMRAGTAWLQPPRIEHTVLDYSDDCELLEIILPAEFDTVEL